MIRQYCIDALSAGLCAGLLTYLWFSLQKRGHIFSCFRQKLKELTHHYEMVGANLYEWLPKNKLLQIVFTIISGCPNCNAGWMSLGVCVFCFCDVFIWPVAYGVAWLLIDIFYKNESD